MTRRRLTRLTVVGLDIANHLYANDKALEGYRSDTFPDGAVIIFDLLDAVHLPGLPNRVVNLTLIPPRWLTSIWSTVVGKGKGPLPD